LKCGRVVSLVRVSTTVNVPGSVDIPTVNSLALLIPVTLNVPLNPELPAPVLLLPLFAFMTSTKDPTDRLCGISVIIFALEDEKFAFAMKLKFLCCATFVKFSDPKYV